jgi:hypothetical protein
VSHHISILWTDQKTFSELFSWHQNEHLPGGASAESTESIGGHRLASASRVTEKGSLQMQAMQTFSL